MASTTDIQVKGAKLVPNKSGSYRRVEVEGTTVALLYARKASSALYIAPAFAKGLPKSIRARIESQPGNGRYSERIKAADAKAVQAVVDHAMKALAAAQS